MTPVSATRRSAGRSSTHRRQFASGFGGSRLAALVVLGWPRSSTGLTPACALLPLRAAANTLDDRVRCLTAAQQTLYRRECTRCDRADNEDPWHRRALRGLGAFRWRMRCNGWHAIVTVVHIAS
jgi:hypothetical protein